MATKVISWSTGSGNITLTYQGQGNGPISVVSDPNDIGSTRSQVITVETNNGTISKNLTISQAACPFPVGDIRNFSYTGSYQEVELPAGSYKLQVWGAQGGSNAAESAYGITAQAGGKGGYSEGVITLSQKTTVRVYVGGQGSSSAGGFNGGGNTTGRTTYNANNILGVTRMGGGGGGTDIRLSDGGLLSRMIVAGGGSGGAMGYKAVTTTTTQVLATYTGSSLSSTGKFIANNDKKWWTYSPYDSALIDVSSYRGKTAKIYKGSSSIYFTFLKTGVQSDGVDASFASGFSQVYTITSSSYSETIPSDAVYLYVEKLHNNANTTPTKVEIIGDVPEVTETRRSKTGLYGGGTTGGGDSYVSGKQTEAGYQGSFGQGAYQNAAGYRWASGAGGGGWYGGGRAIDDDAISIIDYSGGGSGWVNTAASAGNRPSGYTGLQLDSGETKAGNTSFPAPSGGNETGHEGNGYARITRLA